MCVHFLVCNAVVLYSTGLAMYESFTQEALPSVSGFIGPKLVVNW
jgi:hypothetical protein